MNSISEFITGLRAYFHQIIKNNITGFLLIVLITISIINIFLLSEQPLNLSIESQNWMQYVDGSINLRHMAIPGTHDTCAIQEAEYGKCQNMTLREQFDAGVRYVDIRAQPDETPIFRIFHAKNDQKITFDEVLDICKKFLEENPSEMILMRLKKENGQDIPAEVFQAKFLERYHKNWGYLFYRGISVPSLGELRGKIFLLYEGMVKLSFGAPWTDEVMFLQDDYKLVQEEKVEKIIAHYNKAISRDMEDRRLYISHFSAANRTKGINPPKNAEVTNPVGFTFKNSKCGTLIFDFPSKELLRHVFMLNFDT